MAGPADPSDASALQFDGTRVAREPTTRRSLPAGPCNYRDVASGQCGCDQFWDEPSAELQDASSARSTWCVCTHHACFHLRSPRTQYAQHSATRIARSDAYTEAGAQQFAQRSEAHEALLSAQCKTSNASPKHASLSLTNSHSHRSDINEKPLVGRVQESASDLPSVPSVCMISHDKCPIVGSQNRLEMNQSRRTVTGLGLSMMQLHSADRVDRQQSPSPTIPDDASMAQVVAPSFHEAENANSLAQSIATESLYASTARGVLDQVIAFNRLQTEFGDNDTIPDTYNPNDFIQSATEIATPSLAGTPDLHAADQAVQEGKQLIDTIARLTSEQLKGSPSRPTGATPALGSQRWLSNASAAASQDQLHTVLRTASPQAVQKLVSYLAPLHNLLNSIPNVANTMRELGSRLDVLENGSFNYVQPECLDQTLSMYDDRLVDLETRLGEHERYHQAMDTEHSSTSSRRRIDNVTASFTSNHSLQSTTSSALVLAAMDQKDTEMELGKIKDRLEILEASALPSSLQPWEVEVVLLPWGRELRGIWFSPDEPMHDASHTTTQESEEWTQAQNSKLAFLKTSSRALKMGHECETVSSPYTGMSSGHRATIFSDTESGWSSQAISNWASGSAEDWLFPKACGNNNMVYKRLQSRGFIRNVTLRGASARYIQVALSNAFGDLLDHLSYTDQDGDTTVDAYPGLRASFIPLRKTLKESKLRFLSPPEMSSSALWSAQFLASGVIMRVSGGRKRLYVTQREAYMQHGDDLGSSWTWSELRQLPRYQADQDSQMEGNDEPCQPAVQEADAKEACWQYVEAYDAPPASVHSSFESHGSVQMTMRPADRSWRRSMTPSSILKSKLARPISPLSEKHPRPSQLRNRTASASIVELALVASAKRRHNSSPAKQASAPQSASRAPSVSIVRPKRRRTANSVPSQDVEDAPADAHVTLWNPTPRLSREPPSPFYSSLPGLPRTNSDVASRPSQRSLAIAGKSTPFAYATPHSGPIVGGRGFGGFDAGGDTEPDDDNDAYESDAEQSWRGVMDDDSHESSSLKSSNADAQVEDDHYGASFSGDDSAFGSGSESGEDDIQSTAVAQQQASSSSEDEEEEDEDGDVFDTLLDVLEH